MEKGIWRKIQEHELFKAAQEAKRREEEEEMRRRIEEEEARKIRIKEEKLRREFAISHWNREVKMYREVRSECLSILNEIKRNYPEIRSAKQSRIIVNPGYNYTYARFFGSDPDFGEQSLTDWGSIKLQWGNKLELTPADKEILKKHKYWKSMFSTGSVFHVYDLSDRIEEINYSYVVIAHDHDYFQTQIEGVEFKAFESKLIVNNNGRISFKDFLNNPDIIIPHLTKALLKPLRYYERFENYYPPVEDTDPSKWGGGPSIG